MREPVAGERLDQYQLDDLLARSGMASIFRATDTETGESVALKIPHPQLESDVVFFERFKREEQMGQRLDHPAVVKVLTPRAKSRMYIAMEYVDGRSLRSIIQADGPLPRERALDIARQIAEALEYLHRQGVVHRDIKPENILLTANGKVKILDFGIALDESKRRLTWTGLSATLGTPDYMAPEQIGGRRGDARTDVYAVGTLLYEMLTKNLPFNSTNATALLRAKANEDPRPPSYYEPKLDPALEAIVMRSIQRAPRDRYHTAEALLADLRDPQAALQRAPEAPRPRRGARALRRAGKTALVLGVLAGLGALIYLSNRHAEPPSAAPAR
ncbi:MAG TPA: serine/threonine-protein kinase [Polyangia bacterium]|nr:serine/threonine-protein kinase [Polyangia bacterium]